MSMPRSDFWKNFSTVLAGAVGAQALPLLVAPLLTRMCTPSDMGAFSVWLGVIAVASIVATLRFEAAMALDHEKRQQRVCFSVVAYFATLLALALTACVAAARVAGLSAVGAMSWFALLTIGARTWLTAFTQTTLAYAASHKLFDKAAKAWQVALFVMTVSVFVAPLTLHECLLGYAVGRSALYMVYLAMSYRCARSGPALIRSAGRPAGPR